MRLFQILLLAVAVTGCVLASDIPVAVPEIGMDGTTIAGTIGLVGGMLLVMRSRRNKK